MNNQKRGGDAPIKVTLEADKKYSWCTCGHSAEQPFCNGSHRAAHSTPPMAFTVSEKKDVHLCTCKLTSNPPYCDGSHKN